MADTSNRRFDQILDEVYKDFYGSYPPGSPNAGLRPQADSSSVLPEEGNSAGAVPEDKPKTQAATGPSGPKKDAPEAKDEPKPEKSGMEELGELIGLDAVKDDVKELVNLVKVQKIREDKGLKTVPVSLHLVFTGNPGTGKTTVARILSKLYKEIGVLTKGQLVEVDRSGLVAGYVGQTAIKTQKKVEEAKGGVLFIDEAYTLAKEGNDFGQEAIDTILKAMEDNRKDLVVIVAGYTNLMESFINSNPGLKSRFNKYLEFKDYTADELVAIFDMQCNKYNYKVSPDARTAIERTIREREASKGDNFANARDVRNLFETIITNQASRVAQIDDPSEEELTTIEAADVDGSAATEAADVDGSAATEAADVEKKQVIKTADSGKLNSNE
ncbi:MAG: AAA family ATPase [Lachnospiraceae bacterium]|nr:AAA family ATPase [Lachnospiraceae bacterium]